MSLDVLTAVWRDPPCKGGDLLCLLAIADNADETGYAWPSISTIARKAAMGERGAQKCVKKLDQAGLINIKTGGGRNRTNAYQITTNGVGEHLRHTNPEQNTPPHSSPFTTINPEQSDINPEPAFAKPRTPVHPNSHEPPKEPPFKSRAEKKSDPILSILCQVSGVTEKAALSFIKYRKSHKSKALTETAAERLANGLFDIHGNGHDPSDALGLAEERGWASVNLEWYENSKPKQQIKTINGGRNDRANQNTAGQHRDPALEQALRLAGVSQAQGNAFDGVGGFGEEV